MARIAKHISIARTEGAEAGLRALVAYLNSPLGKANENVVETRAKLQACGNLAAAIPVYEERVLLRAEVVLIAGPELLSRLEKSPEHRTTVAVKGVLRYQACDERTCFETCEVPVAWELGVHELDLERTEPELRKPVK